LTASAGAGDVTEEEAATALSSPSADIRSAACKALQRRVAAGALSPPAWLRPLLLARLPVEADPKALRRTLQLLYLLPAGGGCVASKGRSRALVTNRACVLGRDQH
jgi:hypothetical protein